MLEFENITIGYQNNIAVKDFSLTVSKGEIVVIVGESGSGKTTVLRSAIGLLPNGGKIQSGEIKLHGSSITTHTQKQWDALRGKEIAMIFQDCGSMLNPIRTIGSQFIEYIRCHQPMGKQEAYDKCTSLLEETGLYDGKMVMSALPSKLSGGMRQRVGIAMSMAFQPSLLLADEPTSALDVTIQAQIVRQLLDLRKQQETAMLIVTHNIGVAGYMADKIIVMQDGNVVESGHPDQILKNPTHQYTKHLISAVPDLEGERYV